MIRKVNICPVWVLAVLVACGAPTATETAGAPRAMADALDDGTGPTDAASEGGDPKPFDGSAPSDTAVAADTVAPYQDGAVADGPGLDADGVDAGTAQADGQDAGTDAGLPVDGTATTAIPLDQLLAALLDAHCSPGACQGAPAGSGLASAAVCKAYLASDVSDAWAGLVAKAKAGQLTYDPGQAAACVAHLATVCPFVPTTGKPYPACAATFTGNLAAGGACDVDDDCASGWCDRSSAKDPTCKGICKVPGGKGAACPTSAGCLGDLACVGGKCAALVPASAGQPCVEVACASGLYCSMYAEVPICLPLVAPGKPCDDANACTPGHACQFADDAPATCQPLSQIGQPCAGFDSLTGQGGGCAPGLVCAVLDPEDEAAKTICLPLVPLGGVCQAQAQCGAKDLVCKGAGPGKPGVCANVPGKGQACDPAPQCCGQGLICFPGLACDPGQKVCIDAPGPGKACIEGICAAGMTCIDEVCSPPAEKGQACDNFLVTCANGLVCSEGKCAPVVCVAP